MVQINIPTNRDKFLCREHSEKKFWNLFFVNRLDIRYFTIPAHFARHLLLYVRSLAPQTGRYSLEQSQTCLHGQRLLQAIPWKLIFVNKNYDRLDIQTLQFRHILQDTCCRKFDHCNRKLVCTLCYKYSVASVACDKMLTPDHHSYYYSAFPEKETIKSERLLNPKNRPRELTWLEIRNKEFMKSTRKFTKQFMFQVNHDYFLTA